MSGATALDLPRRRLMRRDAAAEQKLTAHHDSKLMRWCCRQQSLSAEVLYTIFSLFPASASFFHGPHIVAMQGDAGGMLLLIGWLLDVMKGL